MRSVMVWVSMFVIALQGREGRFSVLPRKLLVYNSVQTPAFLFTFYVLREVRLLLCPSCQNSALEVRYKPRSFSVECGLVFVLFL